MAERSADSTTQNELESPLPRVLLVEDSQTTIVLLSRSLSEHYSLLQAKDGEEAWELLQEDRSIEVVITDIVMPRLTGHQLLVKIRKSDDSSIRNLPVIVMTTADDNVDKNLAFLNGANDFVSKPIDPTELQSRVNVHHKLSRTIRELEASRKLLAEQASTDPLTQLKNRRAFFEHGAQHMSLSKRYKSDLSILLIDIDHFKKVNDTYGHQAGDEVLTQVARLLKQLTRNEDTVARMGGEEFAILLPDTNRLGTAVMAERIRVAVEKEKIIVGDNTITITLSIGVATYGSEKAESVDDLLRIADSRLYLAKENGRNRICVNDDGWPNFSPSPIL